MRFVSNRGEYRFVVVGETYQWRKDQHGADHHEMVAPGYTAQFVQGVLTPHEKVAAMQHWGGQGSREDGTLKGFGAHPMIQGGILKETVPFDPRWRFSAFDTNWIDNPVTRAIAEEKLCDPQYNNNEHIMVAPERILEPWPGYDQMRGVKGRPLAETIATHAANTGQLVAALAYERVMQNRPNVVGALEAEMLRGAEMAAEEEVLVAPVPA